MTQDTTEMLKIHGFTHVDELNHTITDETVKEFILDVNKILPGSLFAVYDNTASAEGYYLVEHLEVAEYTEAKND